MADVPPEPASLDEERALVERILATPNFQHNKKGHRSRDILKYLFKRHSGEPGCRVSEADIAKDVYAPIVIADGDSTVRQAVGRLRKALERYFVGPGAGERGRVAISDNSYSLEFSRLHDQAEMIRWFWGRYLDKKSDSIFGLVVPTIKLDWDFGKHLDHYPPIYAYRSFARMLFSRKKDLTILPSNWQNNGESIARLFHNPNRNVILIGTDTCMTEQAVPERFGPTRVQSSAVVFLGDQLDLKMFVDPAGHTSIAIRNPKPGQPPIIGESPDIVHVLLSRYSSTTAKQQITLLASKDARAISSVARFVTSPDTLSHIEARPEFSDPAQPLDQAPSDFQILFAVPAATPDSVPGIQLCKICAYHYGDDND